MSVKLLDKDDLDPNKRKERWSFFGTNQFKGAVGRGDLFLTRDRANQATEATEQEWDAAAIATAANTAATSEDSASRRRSTVVVASRKRKQTSGPQGGDVRFKKSPSPAGSISARSFHQLSFADQETLIKELYEKIIETLKTPRRCVGCGANFDFYSELGRRNCAWHSGVLVRGATWSCCNEPYDADMVLKSRKNGCRRCDHNDAPIDTRNPPQIRLPVVLAIYLGISIEVISGGALDMYQPDIRAMCDIPLVTFERLPRTFKRLPTATEVRGAYRPNTMRESMFERGVAVPSAYAQTS